MKREVCGEEGDVGGRGRCGGMKREMWGGECGCKEMGRRGIGGRKGVVWGEMGRGEMWGQGKVRRGDVGTGKVGGESGGGERWENKPFPCPQVPLYSRAVAIDQADP